MHGSPFFKIHPLALALMLSTPLVHAQTSATGATGKSGKLNTVKIEADADQRYTTNETTLGKTTATIKDTPQSITVVTHEKLDAQNISTLPDALKYVTGVTVQRFDGAGFFNTFNARGYAADTFQLDGINVQTNANMADTDLVVFERVEIQRGAAGLFQGSGEPGVTVNLVRKRALADTKIQGMISAGSWNAYRAEADVTGALNSTGDLRGRLVTSIDDRNSYLDGVFGKRQVVYGTLEYNLQPATIFSVGGTWQNIDSVIDQGLPAYANGTLIDVPRSTAIIADWNELDMETSDVFAELEHYFSNGDQLKFLVRHVERERLYAGARSTGAIAANGNIAMENIWFPSDLEDTSADIFYSHSIQAGERKHEFTVGADYRTSDNGTPYAGYALSPARTTSNIFNHNPHTPKPELVKVTTGGPTNTETNQHGFYARGKIEASERWNILLGGRLSWWDSEQIRTDTGAVTTPKYDASEEFTPYAAVMFDINDEIGLYVSYSDIFKAQNNKTKSGEQIKPRTGEQYEAGIKGEFLAGKLNAHAAVYRLQDESRALPDPEDNQFSIAAGEVRSEGFETEISGQLTANWELTAGYAYTKTEYLQAPANQIGQSFAPFIPKHNVNLWSKYNFNSGILQGFYVGGGLRTASDFYSGNNTLRFEAPGYTIASLAGGYAIDEHWKLTLNIENVLDKKYYEKVSGTTRQNFYGAPLNATLSLRGSF